MDIKNENYIVIQGFMRKELNLKGNDLLVYAIIYGFSQSNQGKFIGSRQYLADWCGCSIRTIQTSLNNLVDLGYILKDEYYDNGIKYCDYCINFRGSEKIALGSEKIALYNTLSSNTLSSNTTNKISSILGVQCENFHKQDDNFLGSAEPPKKQSLYSKCVSLIYDMTDDRAVVDKLVEFLNVLLENSKESGKQLYANTFKGKLNQLKKLPKKDWLDIIQQTLDNGWLGFYELKSNNMPSFDHTKPSKTYTEDDLIEQEKWRKEMEASGKRTKF